MVSLSQLPYLPISMAALQESPLFMSADPRLVRAGIWMQDAAFKSAIPGSIQSSFSALSAITRLSEADVEKNYDLLTAGWDLREDGRLHHEVMSVLVARIDEQFGAQMDVMSASVAVAVQGVDAFDLLPPAQVKKAAKKRGHSQISNDFQPDATSMASLIKNGFVTDEYREWLIQSFIDYAQSKAVKYVSWQAAFRTYASSSITAGAFRSRFGFMPGAAAPSASTAAGVVTPVGAPQCAADRMRDRLRSGHSPATRPQSFSQQTASRNSSVMAQALMGRRAQGAQDNELHESQDGVFDAASS